MYRLEDHPAKPSYRLLTTLLDPEKNPAEDLAALYPERWEIEGAFDELKTHLRGGRVVLLSKTADLVEQELYGLMLAHRAVRALMWQAASGRDPDRLSFTHTVRVVRRKLASPGPVFPPARIEAWLHEIASELAVSSRGRRVPRGVKRKMSGYALPRGRAPTAPVIYHAQIHRTDASPDISQKVRLKRTGRGCDYLVCNKITVNRQPIRFPRTLRRASLRFKPLVRDRWSRVLTADASVPTQACCCCAIWIARWG